MRKGFVTLALTTFFAVACVAGVASARSIFSHNSSTRSFDLTVDEPTSVAGIELQPGTYKVTVPTNVQNPEVEFSQYGKVVATVNGTVQPETSKNPHTEFVSEQRGGDHVMTEIDPGGLNERIVLNGAGETGSKS